MRISCPECDAVLKSAEDFPAGKSIRCPKCECSFRIPAAARKTVHADDDDEEETPRRHTQRRKDKQSSSALFIGSIVAGCVVLFAMIGVGAYLVISKAGKLFDDDKDVVGGKNTKIVGTKGNIQFGRGGQPLADSGPKVRQPAPEIEGNDSAGKRIKLSDFRGKIVVLAFWAGREKNSVDSLGQLRELNNRFAGQGLALLGVNRDDKIGELKKIEKDKQITWPSLYDGPNGSIAQEWKVNKTPEIFVIDQKGVLQFQHLQGKDLDQAVSQLMRDL
jgi:peroxiredoxin